MGWYGLDCSGSGWGQGEGSCEKYTEPSGSIESWEVAAQRTVPGIVFSSIELGT
jgi:hypothetical protein